MQFPENTMKSALFDFDNKISVNGKSISPIDELAELFKLNCVEYCWIKENLPFTNKFVKSYRYEIVQKLLEWHFNIFNLPENLFINYNDIKL